VAQSGQCSHATANLGFVVHTKTATAISLGGPSGEERRLLAQSGDPAMKSSVPIATVHDEAQMPFGGMKDSGYGRFGGKAAINEFTELRWITIQSGHRHYPF